VASKPDCCDFRALSVQISGGRVATCLSQNYRRANRAVPQIDGPKRMGLPPADQAIVIMLSTSTADTTIRLNRLRSEFEKEVRKPGPGQRAGQLIDGPLLTR